MSLDEAWMQRLRQSRGVAVKPPAETTTPPLKEGEASTVPEPQRELKDLTPPPARKTSGVEGR